ncbi:glycosyltransferase family 10 [uncultured Polaribacter sp.]|uniref:glycosyltransferase family 10 domain-containing protein n=1 Tax=uncultured Polaribacter sp. TaxID=174711 RepID=UPI00262E6A78|nr:glycosyltransferase family 10 [uncultured Polaribacter sp.]
MIVKIERYYDFPDLKRQTPKETFKWKDITFTEEDIEECDFLVILEYPKKDFSIKVPKNNIIHICQEPPNEISKYRQFANKNVSYNFNQIKKSNVNQIKSHGALPWFVNKNYDFLKNIDLNDLCKEDTITWVTSNQKSSFGHKKRMEFFEKIKDISYLRMYGKGFKYIEDKWDALSVSKYSIAFENFESEIYWTEKITDCFLSFTMPIYFGCSTISDFFPKDSFIQLDPKDKHLNLFFKEIVESNKYEKNLDAIIESRNLILEEYQLFPFISNQIRAIQSKGGFFNNKEFLFFKGGDAYFNNTPFSIILEKKFEKTKKRIKKVLQLT